MFHSPLPSRIVKAVAAAGGLALGLALAPNAAAVTTQTAPATAMPEAVSVTGQIAYVARGPSTIPFGSPVQDDVWVMNPDGTGKVNLTDSTDIDDFSPVWSPDGTKIAYISGAFTQNVMVMNADGTGKQLVTTGAVDPSWGPDNSRLAVLKSREGLSPAVVIIDLATGTEQFVTEAAQMDVVWSPDGGKVAFVAVRPETYPDPIDGTPIEGAQWEIVLVNADGTGAETVLTAGAPGTDRANYLEEDRHPTWSPDGQMLVFMSQDQIPSCCGAWQLWGVNRDGSGITNLSNDPTVNDMYPSWSPDGTSIVFTRYSGGGEDLFAMSAPTSLPLPAPAAGAQVLAAPSAATGPVTQLTSDGNSRDPAWGGKRATPVAKVALTVKVTGRGTVTSSPAGISCGKDCTESYAVGTPVTLQAVPGRGAKFKGWSGACTGSALTCTVPMSAATKVSASFTGR